MTTSYRIVIRDPGGDNPRVISNAISLEAARAVNTVGSASLVIPDDGFNPDYWLRDMRLEFWRVAGNGFTYLLGNTIWLARRFVWMYDQKQWLIEAKDTNDLFGRRIIAYTGETDYADKIEDFGADDPADNLMRAYVRENLGSDAQDTTRDISTYLDVELDRDLAPITSKEAAWQGLDSVLNDLANDAAAQDTRLFYSVDPIPDNRFLFRVRRGTLGQDRVATQIPVVFGPAYRNLTDIQIEWDYRDEKTVVYAGGDGEGAGKLWVKVTDPTRTNKSPFGVIETFIDIKDQDVDVILQIEAEIELAKHRPKLRVTGQAVETPVTQFGRDYFYGDIVAIQVGDLKFNCVVDAFSISYREGKESDLNIRLNGEMSL